MSATPRVRKSRNLLNMDHVDKVCTTLGRRSTNEHVIKWFNTTFKRWFQNEAPHTKFVVDAAEKLSFNYRMMESLHKSTPEWVDFEEQNHYVEASTLPDWAREALAKKETLYYIELDDAGYARYLHVVDYLNMTEPTKLVSSTPEVVFNEVRLWDKRLAKQKILGSLADGVSHDTIFEHDTYYFVSLDTEQAYLVEGSAMAHCVGTHGYWERKDCEIVSMRSFERESPIATIELQIVTPVKRVLRTVEGLIKKTLSVGKPEPILMRVVQVQGCKGSALTEEQHSVLAQWALSKGYELAYLRSQRGFGENYYEDENGEICNEDEDDAALEDECADDEDDDDEDVDDLEEDPDETGEF